MTPMIAIDDTANSSTAVPLVVTPTVRAGCGRKTSWFTLPRRIPAARAAPYATRRLLCFDGIFLLLSIGYDITVANHQRSLAGQQVV